MELHSFKELLLKKAEGNPTLQTLIKYAKDEILAEKVLESLQKMARPHASMGRGANAGIVAFANQLKNKDVEMMRDALAHHISHYKGALKNGKRDVADQHLKKIVHHMHLAGRASAHSGGQLGLDYVPLEPWETNYTTTERHTGTTGKLKEGTKGLGRRPKSKHPEGGHESRTTEHKNVPDYRYLEMPPHSGHSDVKNLKHKGGYPFEEIQIGNSSKIDAGEAYLHQHDVEPQDTYVDHPFDFHPVHKIADTKQDALTPNHVQNFVDSMSSWHDHPEHKKWNETVKEHYTKDPEAFKARGKTKAAHHFEGMPLLNQPSHAKATSAEAVAPAVEQVATTVAPSVPAQTSAPAFDMSKLSPALQAKFGGKSNV